MKTDTQAALHRLMQSIAQQPAPQPQQEAGARQFVGQMTGNIIIVGSVPHEALEMILRSQQPISKD